MEAEMETLTVGMSYVMLPAMLPIDKRMWIMLYRVLVGKPEGKRPLGRPRRRWVDNIRMDLQEVGCGNVDWIGLAQDRQVADACE